MMTAGGIPSHITLKKIVGLALDEDLGRGDLTTEACVPEATTGGARMMARGDLVFCGLPVVQEVYAQVDPRVQVTALASEGAKVAAGDALVGLSGPAQALLMGERVALNFVQRMCAVATATRQCVDALPTGTSTRVTDTRKTTPGLRALERYAVRQGGGHNHREDLGAAVLIKDNHIAAAGSVTLAVTRAKARAPHTGRITCEVDTLAQLQEALDAGADVVMLDNFDAQALAKGVAMVAGRALIEVSGGVTAARVRALAEAGAQIISVGGLTHSAGSVDIGLDWDDV